LAVTLGILLSYIVGFAFTNLGNEENAWRLMLGTGGALFPILLLYMISCHMLETVQFKRSVNDEEARQLTSKTSDLEKNEKSGWGGLFTARRIPQVITGLILAGTLQLTGINAVMYYGPDIIKKAGFTNEFLLNIIIGGWNFLATFIAVFLVERTSRRFLIVGGTGIMSIALVVVGVSFKYLTDVGRTIGVGVGLLVFIGGFEAGVGCLFWVLVNEVFDEEVREAGGSMANVAQWGFNLVVSSLFGYLGEAVGTDVTFYIFGGIGVLCCIYLMFALKGSSKKEIDT